MKFVDEFRDPDKAKTLVREIKGLVTQIDVCRHRPLQILEVCGGHTQAIFGYGIEQMLPGVVELVHGPGCPVCVLPMGRVDDCVALAETTGVIFTTFGDARPTAPQRSPAATARVSRRRTSCKAPATKAAKSQKPQTSCTARPLF
jgi:hydrogenase expression/formation protein HypD